MSETSPKGSLQVEELLTPLQVAEVFRVNPKTVSRWARSGKLKAIRTPGGHHRFSRSQVEELSQFGDFDVEEGEEVSKETVPPDQRRGAGDTRA